MPRIIMKDLNFIICFIFFYHPIWDGGASSNRPSAIQERAQSGEARGTGVPWAERAEWFLPRLWQSTFILCFWKNKVLFTFHLARFFYLLSLLVSLHQTSVILALLFFSDTFCFFKTSGRSADSCDSLWPFDDWWNCLQIPLLVST